MAHRSRTKQRVIKELAVPKHRSPIEFTQGRVERFVDGENGHIGIRRRLVQEQVLQELTHNLRANISRLRPVVVDFLLHGTNGRQGIIHDGRIRAIATQSFEKPDPRAQLLLEGAGGGRVDMITLVHKADFLPLKGNAASPTQVRRGGKWVSCQHV